MLLCEVAPLPLPPPHSSQSLVPGDRKVENSRGRRQFDRPVGSRKRIGGSSLRKILKIQRLKVYLMRYPSFRDVLHHNV